MAKMMQKSKLRDTLDSDVLMALVGRRHIMPGDITALRGSDLGLGLRSKAEAEAMFAIERSPAKKCRAWGDFLVESLTDFVVWDQRPSGVLTEDVALWISDQVGDTPTPACLALLVAILDEAHDVPEWFRPAVRLRAHRVHERLARDGVQQAA